MCQAKNLKIRTYDMALPVDPNIPCIPCQECAVLEISREPKTPSFRQSDADERINGRVQEKTFGLKTYYEKDQAKKRLEKKLMQDDGTQKREKKYEKWRSGLIADPPAQEVVKLDKKWLKNFPADLKHLGSLVELSLRSNVICDVTAEQIEGLHLTKLDLSENPLWCHYEELAFPSTLETLTLETCGLTEVPCSITSLLQLRELNVTENQLLSFPKEIGRLQCLVVLSAEKNKLSSLPDELWLCKKLQELHLRKNSLPGVSQGVRDLPDLKQLDIRENPICSDPQACDQLRRTLQATDLVVIL
jgi:hypothetical protein